MTELLNPFSLPSQWVFITFPATDPLHSQWEFNTFTFPNTISSHTYRRYTREWVYIWLGKYMLNSKTSYCIASASSCFCFDAGSVGQVTQEVYFWLITPLKSNITLLIIWYQKSFVTLPVILLYYLYNIFSSIYPSTGFFTTLHNSILLWNQMH